ncbi:MAG: DoxX family protein [Marmoricola sp.]
MTAITIIVAIALGLLFLAAAASKLSGSESSTAMSTHLGVHAGLWKAIGVLELAGAAGVLAGLAVEPLGIAASCGLVLLSAGAVVSHVRAGDAPRAAAPALVGLLLASATTVLLLV